MAPISSMRAHRIISSRRVFGRFNDGNFSYHRLFSLIVVIALFPLLFFPHTTSAQLFHPKPVPVPLVIIPIPIPVPFRTTTLTTSSSTNTFAFSQTVDPNTRLGSSQLQIQSGNPGLQAQAQGQVGGLRGGGV